ncbi:protein RETICULATA-RELATED 5, chloroplastic-like isoform X2 [Abrus precatorius]|uniref:Protein RETICULATA-RELATED 5, chloroplastic-like isoform X2 n=1 Tax=Abrus precatorius TaxID=3816 RepID=A0A8B8JT89_ABRPR|nr:protein RETICULATA-RELATED 5, chloroplastic-like isoform X2 [Abrus precatorius]
MKPHTRASFNTYPPHVPFLRPATATRVATFETRHDAAGNQFRRVWTTKRRRLDLSVRHSNRVVAASKPEAPDGERVETRVRSNRRGVLMAPFLAAGASILLSAAATARAEEKVVESTAPKVEEQKKIEEAEGEVITSRIYDATVIGEPLAIGKEKGKVWEKLMNSRVVYLGEAEQVPVRDDKELELEIVKNLHRRCLEKEKRLSLALEAFPTNLQEPLNQYMDKKIDGDTLKSYTLHWPPERWQEYEPILSYCRENGIRLVACGTPLKILRTVQAEGIRGLTKAERKLYAPPAGSGFISGFTSMSRRPSVDSTQNLSIPFGPSSYLSAQAKVVDEYSMSQIILQNVLDGGASDMLIVVTGASHVTYGSRGTGLVARVSQKIQKRNQAVVLLDPERQFIRREGEVPVADFLWYSAARPCSRNCFDRAEIARVMNAAGRRRDALPQDLQKGIDLGLVSPEVLQNFFDLEQYPLISELTHRFQGFRERLLADPKFLHRLAIEEAISITTTLLAQYEKRKENFFQELDYVITDTVRGSVVDFFTVWLPAPTLSFLSYADEMNAPDNLGSLMGLLGSIPDNAFQKNPAGTNWNLNHRIASVVFGGLKLASVGFISSIGAVASSNSLYAIRKFLNPAVATEQRIIRSPIIKTAVIYASFLGISANLRYQIIAGIVEHRISEQFSSQTFLVNMLSFVARTINSYWGTQQWIDLARFTGLQVRKTESPTSDSPNHTAILCNETEEANVDDVQNK